MESILKQDADHPPQEGANLVTYRQGGALRFPSGHLRRIIVMGHGFPAVGDRYVLFLSHEVNEAGRYYIERAHQLKGGLVYLLDETGGPYEGMQEKPFLDKVRSVLGGDSAEVTPARELRE